MPGKGRPLTLVISAPLKGSLIIYYIYIYIYINRGSLKGSLAGRRQGAACEIRAAAEGREPFWGSITETGTPSS